MEPLPVTSYHLEQLAGRVAWSRVFPGLVLLVVGVSQPFATLGGEGDEPNRSFALTTVVRRHAFLEHGTAAATFAVLAIVAAFLLGVVALSAVANRTDRSRQVTVVLAVMTAVLGVLAVVSIGSAEPMVGDDVSMMPAAQGPVPFVLGAVGVWVAAARAKDPGRLTRRPELG